MAAALKYRTVFSTPWFAIEESLPPANGAQTYFRMTAPDGIICLPLTPEGDIVMVRQRRPTLDIETVEIPAGSIDGDETALGAAHREILEETGYECGHLVQIGSGRFYPNRLTQREYMFVGLDSVPRAGSRIEDGLAPVIVSRQSFLDHVGEDSVGQTAVYFLLGMTQARYGIDLLRAPMEIIRNRLLGATQKG